MIILNAAVSAAGIGSGETAKGYLSVLSALMLLVLSFVTSKSVQKRLGPGPSEALAFVCSRSLIATVILFCAYCLINRGIPEVTGYSLLLAFLVSLFSSAYTMIGFRIMKYGSLSVYTVFLVLGGMIVPYLYGVIFLKEAVSPARIAGVALIMISLLFPIIGRARSHRKDENGKSVRVIFVVLCFAVFLLNGMISVITKTHASRIFDFPSSDDPTFVMLCSGASFLVSGAALSALSIYRKIKRGRETASENAPVENMTSRGTALRSVLVIIVLAAIFDAGSFFLQQVGAANLPASVMFPIQTGGSVVLTALAGFLLFHEKPGKIELIGLILTFASTFLFLF